MFFFREMCNSGHPEEEVVEAWQGPEDSHHDYIFSDVSIEIKSLSGRERNSVHISSEYQLDKINSELFLKIFRLSASQESKNLISLNDLVKSIEKTIQSAEALEKFSTKLAKSGYVELREYDTPKFTVIDEKSYDVVSAFPKLVRATLPAGVIRTRYDIELERIKPFEYKNEAIKEKLRGTILG